jgi:hypothetical protein
MLRLWWCAALAACGGSHAAQQADDDMAPADAGSDTVPDAAVACPNAWTCTAAAQAPAPVTFAHQAPGVMVRQLTTNGVNFLTYGDVPAAAACGRVLYGSYAGQPKSHKTIYAANADGTGAVELGAAVGGGLEGIYVTNDSALAYWVQGSGNDPYSPPLDLYGVQVADATCGAQRISHLGLAPLAGHSVGDTEISTASAGNVLGFATDNTFHRVAADGTALPFVALTESTPTTGEVFHRVRLNPVCPNILMYRRDNGSNAEPDVWVVDLDAATPMPRSINGATDANHQMWSPDGARVGYAANLGVTYAVVDVVDVASCTLRPTFATTHITPQQGLRAEFCVWTPDRTRFVCDDNCEPANAPTSTNTIYMMTPDGAVEPVLETGRTCGPDRDLYGQPDAQLVDAEHILFASDKGGSAEVYSATLPAGF